MLGTLLRWCRGYVRIRLLGYSPERFLNLCKAHEILIWDLQNTGITYEMCMSVADFKRLRPFLRKTHSRVRVMKRHGLPFFLFRNRRRKMFFIGILLAAGVLYSLSFFVWNIHIDGNISLSTEVLLQYLESEQVVHGMPKSQVDCEAIRTGLRIEFPDIVWVSAEIRGTRLIIHMKENRDSFEVTEEKETEEPADIVAAKEGVLQSVLTRAGVPQVAAGETVEAGQLLISGTVEILDDAGTVIRHQYVTADATIYAETTYEYQDYFLLSHEEQVYTGRKRRTFYLEIGERRLALWPLPDSFANSSILKKEYPLHLTENFYLPVIFGSALREEYEIIVEPYTKEEAETLAKSHLEEFLKNLMQKGVQIIENDVKIRTAENYCEAKGTIYAVEEIGRPVQLVPETDVSLPTDEGSEEMTDEP